MMHYTSILASQQQKDTPIPKLSLESPRLKVVEHQPWRRPVVVFVTALIGATCMLVGYGLGYSQVIFDRAENARLSNIAAQAEGQLERLRSDAIDARLTADVEGEAANALRRDMTQLRQANARLREEVTFYKSLMAPGSDAEGLRVAELEILPTEADNEFNFEVLLTQVALRRRYIAGDLRIEVIGRFAGDHGSPGVFQADVVLPLTELSDINTYPLKFRFRYFQDLAVRITLPEDFLPKTARVSALQKGESPVEATFAWPEL